MQITELKAGDKVEMNGEQGTIGAMNAYLDANGYSAERKAAQIQRSIANRHDFAWVMSRAAFLCDSPEVYERDRQEWASIIQLKDGDIVDIEDRAYRARFVRKGVSDFIKFTPA